MSSWQNTSARDNIPRSRITDGSGRIVSVMILGGIGNRISQILAGLGYAEKTGREFVFYEKHMANNPHSSTEQSKKFLLALFPQVRVLRNSTSWIKLSEDQDFVDISGRAIVLDGYFQDEKYYPSSLRKWFKIPSPSIVNFNSDFIPFDRTWFIHFRFGDYVTTDFNVDLRNYYRKAIDAVLKERNDAVFLIFSDEPTKIPYEDIGLSSKQMHVVPNNIDVWETLWHMNRCWGGITANSSFSWAAAFAVKGSVYMPIKWKNNTENLKILPSWAKGVEV